MEFNIFTFADGFEDDLTQVSSKDPWFLVFPSIVKPPLSRKFRKRSG